MESCRRDVTGVKVSNDTIRLGAATSIMLINPYNSSDDKSIPKAEPAWDHKMGADGVVVKKGPHHDMEVPDGVSQRNEAVRLEEDDAHHVDDPSQLQLAQAGRIRHFEYGYGWREGDDDVEGGLEPLVLFMEGLLVEDAQECEEPHGPPQLAGHATQVLQVWLWM